jgi:hypothetical protein
MGVRPFALLALLLAACIGRTPMPPETVSLRLVGSPKTATVYIDDQPIGQLDFVQAHGVALPPGTHRITVQAPGYFPWDREVQAKAAERVGDVVPPIRLDVSLIAIPE